MPWPRLLKSQKPDKELRWVAENHAEHFPMTRINKIMHNNKHGYAKRLCLHKVRTPQHLSFPRGRRAWRALLMLNCLGGGKGMCRPVHVFVSRQDEASPHLYVPTYVLLVHTARIQTQMPASSNQEHPTGHKHNNCPRPHNTNTTPPKCWVARCRTTPQTICTNTTHSATATATHLAFTTQQARKLRHW